MFKCLLHKFKINPIKAFLLFLLIPSLLIINPEISYSKKKTTISKTSYKKKSKKKRSKRPKRVYVPEQTRKQAINIIRCSSEEVCALAGLEPKIAEKLENYDDSEDVTIINQNFVEEELYYEGENIEELEREDDVLVDIEQFKVLWLSYMDDGQTKDYLSNGIAKSDIMDVVMDWLGTPYRFGGTTNGGIDCSAFVQRMYLLSSKVLLPRTARSQFDVGTKVSREKLEFGDLVFFHTYSRRFASHVGIYLGDDLFVHSSSRYGVTVSSLESTYYNSRFIGGRRLTSRDIAKLSINFHDQDNKQ